MVQVKALYNIGGHVLKRKEDVRQGEVVDVDQPTADRLLKMLYFEIYDEAKETAAKEVPNTAADAKTKATRTPVIVDTDKNRSPGHFGLAGSVVKDKDGKPVKVGGQIGAE